MAGIALVVEADIEREGRAPQPWAVGRTGVSNAISYGACEGAHRVGAAAIVSATFSGATAHAVARNLPAQPIVAVSTNQRVVNQLALCWGVSPLLGTHRGSFEEVVLEANDLVLGNGFAQRGQVVVVTAGRGNSLAGSAVAAAAGAATAIYSSPYVLYGTLGAVRDRLLRRRDKLGISYYTIPSRAMESMAPLVEALAGK